MPIFQGVAPWHTNFTLSCVIPLWDSATAHSPSVKELLPSSLNQSCFSGLILAIQIFHSMCGLFLWRKTAALQRSVARDFSGVSQIYIYIYIFLMKKLYKTVFWFTKKSPWLRAFYCNDTWTYRYYIFWILSFLKLFVTLGVQTSWMTCGEWMGNFGFHTSVSGKQHVTFCC